MHGTIACGRHVVLTTDAVGGVWRYSMAMAAGYAARGWRCTVVILGPSPREEQCEEAHAIGGCTLIDTGLPLDWTADTPSALQDAARTLDALASQVGAQSMHLHTPSLAAYPWSMPVVAVAHSCVGTWWQAVHGTAAPPDFQWRKTLMAQGLRRAGVVIAPSHAVAAALRTEYNLARRIEIVHNGLDRVAHAAAPRARAVLSAGRLWDQGKNMATLDRAAALLDAPVFAAGPLAGPDGARFAPKALRWLGQLAPAALRDQMARAAVFAAPSVYEPFGLAVLEAAQLGTPLVLADNPTFRELWEDAAVFVGPRDVVAWVRALSRILDSPDEATALGARAAARAGMYTARAMVDASVALHAELTMQAA